ncbi:cell division protein FtsA [Paenibacillus cellulosilyticus]|uniref:Cell division protein FtsA n=1 Tax=Paenibacillus cellulosilyticus TaxID=375489 RepID=A0A2V2YQR1_9BACL|nr:cell division protein FtsA [Paenibacillus cellulosilyticus]PWV95470.1 cell division protein FtsA [Paenibacillus cellulosilyticus]QKS43155.1 cell division protein FtsA [Paenibacillus cellulosilyticus]
MSNSEIIVSLDIGTSKVRAIIGEVTNGAINIIGVGSADSEGIRKGAIVDIDQTVRSIRNAIDHAERMVGIQISEVCIGIQGTHIALQTNHGVVAVSNEDREIGEEDIERVMQAARVVALPPEREIIGVVPKQFLVDGLEGISDPRGMIGVRLEVEATIITGTKTSLHNLIRCVEKADLHIAERVLMSLASGSMSLTKDEKTMGTVLVDIGAGSTTVSIFEGGGLVATSTLPVGGEHVTNDISYGLRTHTEQAEKFKLKYGCSLITDAAEDQKFKVMRMGSNVEKEFTQVDLANIIEPRMQEIFHLVRQEVRRLGYGDKVNGYVLTGGTVSMPGTLNLAQQELESSVRIAVPDFIGVRDPAFNNGVGMLQYVVKNARVNSVSVSAKKSAVRKTVTTSSVSTSPKPGLFERLKNYFSEFI